VTKDVDFVKRVWHNASILCDADCITASLLASSYNRQSFVNNLDRHKYSI